MRPFSRYERICVLYVRNKCGRSDQLSAILLFNSLGAHLAELRRRRPASGARSEAESALQAQRVTYYCRLVLILHTSDGSSIPT